MTVSTSIDRIEGEIKRILLTDGPTKPKELLAKIVAHFETQPEYRADIDLEIKQAMLNMLWNDEILFSPNKKLYLPDQKTD